MLRILPRDAFNDANLLKCVGQLTLLIEDGLIPWLRLDYDGEPFDIQQNPDSGATWVANIHIETMGGAYLYFTRPLNSRDAWPLYVEHADEVYPVFDETGKFILEEME